MSKKISELTEVLEPSNSDVMPVVNSSATKKITLLSLIEFIKTALNRVYASITHTHTKSEITDFPSIPSKTSDLTNDSGYITSYTETDPTVPAWAKQSTKPTYTFNEITNKPSTYTPSSHTHTSTEVTGLSTVATSGSYNDLKNKPTIPSAYTLPTASADTLGGVKVGGGLSITNGVLSATGGGTADSVEWNNVLNKPSTYTPSSHTHKKSEITDFPTIPSKTSDLTNDSGFITSYTETDPTVPSWAKQSTKPTYTASEVGAMPVSTVVTAFWSGTQAEYDAITTKNATTLYLITE